MYIVATISKNSYTADKIEEIIRAGATVLRYNFSHGTPEEVRQKIDVAKNVIAALGLVGKIKILADLPGDKIRLGSFPLQEYAVEKGKCYLFTSSDKSGDPALFIPVGKDRIGALLQVGQVISFGDGDVAFEVKDIINDHTFLATAVNSGKLLALKGVNIGRGIDKLDHITPKTIEHIKSLSAVAPDWVAFSFVNSAEYIARAKELLREYVSAQTIKFVSKVESPKALQLLAHIIAASDIVLVARGDLGLTVPIEELGIHQKIVTAMAKQMGKEVIVSTQILESLVTSHTPYRSDVLDLTNIVLDGADGIMLAKETGISSTPGYSVAVAKKIIDYVEKRAKDIPNRQF